jgi:hypothetical protein
MRELHEAHPDAESAPGATRPALGRDWVFGKNQFSSFWRSGPKDGTVICSRDYPDITDRPYVVAGVHFREFEKAAAAARRGAAAEYEKALEIVRRYEAPEKD